MDELKDSSAWLDYFERNRLHRPEPDWDRPTPFPPPVAARLARSLAHFALGESCEGTTLLAGARADARDWLLRRAAASSAGRTGTSRRRWPSPRHC